MLHFFLLSFWSSVGFSDVKWYHWEEYERIWTHFSLSESTWAQINEVMACFLTTQSHYLNQCWHSIVEVISGCYQKIRRYQSVFNKIEHCIVEIVFRSRSDHRVDKQGPVSLTFFLPAIQIRWKLRLAVIPLLAIRSRQHSCRAMYKIL